jgi:hypothetical protein
VSWTRCKFARPLGFDLGFRRSALINRYDDSVSALAPAPSSLQNLWEALAQFDTNAGVMERKFAGSAFATMLLPPGQTTVLGNRTQIQVIVDHQTSLYRGTKENRVAYVFPSMQTDSYLSATRRADFSYCLSNKIYDQSTKACFPLDDNGNHFPCHSATFDGLFPLATGEVKVGGHPYKQRFQQAFYASYYIMSWLILRILQKSAKQDGKRASAEELFNGVRHCCFSISPQTLQIWEYRPCLVAESRKLRISAKLLCCGAPGDQTFMEDVYIPWRRFVLKRGILEQWQHLLPAVKSYAARPYPRPFDHSDTVFLKVRDFDLDDLDLGHSSFGNKKSPDQIRLHEIILPYEEAMQMANQNGRKRKSLHSTDTSQMDCLTGTESSQY